MPNSDVSLSQMIKNNAWCNFDSIRAGFAYYDISYYEPGKGRYTYRFSIPLDDMGNATFNKSEKGITLMRWIRKAMEANELIFIRFEGEMTGMVSLDDNGEIPNMRLIEPNQQDTLTIDCSNI